MTTNNENKYDNNKCDYKKFYNSPQSDEHCFKINIFNIDWYTTKPAFSHDVVYSIYRQKIVKQVTVVRIFGSTDYGKHFF